MCQFSNLSPSNFWIILAEATPKVMPITLESEDQSDFLKAFLLSLDRKGIIPFLDKLDKLWIAVFEAILDIKRDNFGGLFDSL